MKKFSFRLVSAVLTLMTLISMFSCLSVYAAETTTSELATGDLTLENPESIPEVETITSVEDYKEIVEEDAPTASTFSTRSATAASYPSSVDNSASKYFPPIGNQGSVGSCNAWASTYYQFSYEINRKLDRTATVSNSFSPKWVYNKINGGRDLGSYYYDSYEFLKSQGGVTLAEVPYDEVDYKSWVPSETLWTNSQNYKLKGYQEINMPLSGTAITSPTDSDLDVLKAALSRGDVLTYSSYIESWVNTTIKSNSKAPGNNKYLGEYIVTSCKDDVGGHRMTLVGYDDNIWVDINGNGSVETAEMGAFKIANSWGTSANAPYWPNGGNKGFMWISYDALNKVSAVSSVPANSNRVAAFEYIARIDVEDFDSDANINLVYTLNSARRNQAYVTVKAEHKTSGAVHSGYVSPYRDTRINNTWLTHANGSKNTYAFDGTTVAKDATMVFGLDNIVPGITSATLDDYYWTVEVKDDTNDSYALKVSNMKIVDKNTGNTIKANNAMPVSVNGNTTTITFGNAKANETVIYYKGYSTPYIHYQVGSGQWTTAPGYKMPASSEVSGYTHKYTIDLGTSTYANVCFNNGNGTWDSRNGANYKFNAGTYTYSNGVITPYVVDKTFKIQSFTLTPSNGVIKPSESVKMNVTLANATSNACIQYAYIDTNGHEVIIYDYAGATSAQKQFTKEGTYTLIVRAKENFAATKYVEARKTVTVKEQVDNILTIYYKGYSTPYIHYQIGTGTWTSAPGYKMTATSEVSGYTHKYTINLGTSTYANVCFNNGNGTWDSRNGANYKFNAGTYTYSNGTIKEYTVAPLSATLSASKTTSIGLYDNLTFTAKASGGTAPYKYKFSYERYGQTHLIRDYSTTSTCNLQKSEMGPYNVIVSVMDATGKTVTANRSVTYNQTYILDLKADQTTGSVNKAVKFSATTQNVANGVSYVYTVTGNGTTKTLTTASDKTASWTPTAAGTYTVTLSLKYGSTTIISQSMTYNVVAPSLSATLSASKTTAIGLYDKIQFTASAVGGTAPYQYKFTYDRYGQTYTIRDYSTSNTCEFQKSEIGPYNVIVTVKDATGKTVTASRSVTYNQTYILSLNADQTKGTVNKAVKFSASTQNVANGASYVYTVTGNGTTKTLTTASDKTASWTPTAAGTYTVTLSLKSGSTTIISKSISYVVEKVTANTLTIYYKGYSTPYIHYQIGTGTWTSAPGYKMTATSEVSGYTHKYTINLGSSTYANVCFNNGNGTWDSRNGANYKFNAGTYTYSNGTIKEYVVDTTFKIQSFTITPSNGVIKPGESVTMNVTLANATSNACIQYAYIDTNGQEVIIYDYAGATSAQKQFTKEGTYTLIVRAKENFVATKYVEARKTITVKNQTANTLTIYYKGYSTPYIHYQIGTGTWTSAPGYKMTATSEKSGYTHKYTINLGTSTYANVCFNNGSGTWDSRNGANYKFNAGTYTYSNGTMTKIG